MADWSRAARWFLGWVALILCAGSLAGSAAAKNEGGVLVLHSDLSVSPDTPTDQICGAATLKGLEAVKTRLPGDGRRAVIFLYAAFPADSVVDLRAVTFGLRYTANIKVSQCGPCNGGGLAIPTPGWPAAGAGVSFIFEPAVETALVPIYWFIVTCKGPGYFEVTPNPNQGMGGNFADSRAPALTAPIAGYGAVGFDLEGHRPTPGEAAPRGSCCVGERTCLTLTKEECMYYFGDWLGTEVDCVRDEPCQPESEIGACCLPSGCQPTTRRECTRNGGAYLGDKVSCEGSPCPTHDSRGGK